MRPLALRTLTWATVAAAVASAVWLAAVEGGPGTTLRLTASPPAARLQVAIGDNGAAAETAASPQRREHKAPRSQPKS